MNPTDIFQLIVALAIYEKEPDAVKTTTADLLRDGFGDNPYFQCLLFEENEHVSLSLSPDLVCPTAVRMIS